jgi:hypothetical protein
MVSFRTKTHQRQRQGSGNRVGFAVITDQAINFQNLCTLHGSFLNFYTSGHIYF